MEICSLNLQREKKGLAYALNLLIEEQRAFRVATEGSVAKRSLWGRSDGHRVRERAGYERVCAEPLTKGISKAGMWKC